MDPWSNIHGPKLFSYLKVIKRLSAVKSRLKSILKATVRAFCIDFILNLTANSHSLVDSSVKIFILEGFRALPSVIDHWKLLIFFRVI